MIEGSSSKTPMTPKVSRVSKLQEAVQTEKTLQSATIAEDIANHKDFLYSVTARTIHKFVGQEFNELSLNKGDLVTVLQQNEDGWWGGELNGVLGYFPSGNCLVL
jgi:hypothetical protein